MAKYRKKPIVIEAFKWICGDLQTEDPAWFVEAMKAGDVCFEGLGTKDVCLLIKTLEGNMLADQGDYIIQGIKGEIYPCKPDIFEATYEKVEERYDILDCICEGVNKVDELDIDETDG